LPHSPFYPRAPAASQEEGFGAIIEGNPFGATNIGSFNPLRCDNDFCGRITGLLFPTLLGVDRERGVLAPSSEVMIGGSEDGTIYTFICATICMERLASHNDVFWLPGDCQRGHRLTFYPSRQCGSWRCARCSYVPLSPKRRLYIDNLIFQSFGACVRPVAGAAPGLNSKSGEQFDRWLVSRANATSTSWSTTLRFRPAGRGVQLDERGQPSSSVGKQRWGAGV
jgi:hypothetical protein